MTEQQASAELQREYNENGRDCLRVVLAALAARGAWTEQQIQAAANAAWGKCTIGCGSTVDQIADILRKHNTPAPDADRLRAALGRHAEAMQCLSIVNQQVYDAGPMPGALVDAWCAVNSALADPDGRAALEELERLRIENERLQRQHGKSMSLFRDLDQWLNQSQLSPYFASNRHPRDDIKARLKAAGEGR